MSSSTPTASHSRSASRSRMSTPPPRPTTPLRPLSRNSLRASYSTPSASRGHDAPTPDAIAALEPAFAELADGMADLEANFVHLQLLHESVARFNECFASFLYGLNVNAFCVDFPEAPVPESFKRARDNPAFAYALHDSAAAFSRSVNADPGGDPDQTFLTSDTSFVDNPPSTVAKASSQSSRGAGPVQRARGAAAAAAARGTRAGAGAPRGRARGAATGRPRGSGLARPRYGSRGGIKS